MRPETISNDLTAEGAEGTERENREMNNSDATGFDIKPRPKNNVTVNCQLSTVNCQLL
jgi:hypothetical protein